MKKIYSGILSGFIALLVCSSGNLFGQAVVCPSLASTSATLTCAEPCATLTATPSVDLTATTTYSVAAVAYAPFAYGAGTAATFGGTAWSGSTDDSYGDIVPLPFNFCFFGNTYNSIVIGTNGSINFNAAALVNSYDPYSISGPLPGSNCAATENAIMGVWNDTYVGGGNIYHKVYGTAPCRQFVVSWNAVDLFLPGTYCDGNTTTSEIVLYESSNIIDIYIANRQPCTAWNSGYAVCGIENNAGTLFYCPPGENGTTFTATNLGWRFTPTGATSGWTYNWIAPGGASVGTTATVVLCPTVTTVYTVTGTSVACTGVTVSTTATVTPTSTTSPITGTPTMCLGFTTNLTDATPGGTWSSSNPGVATVSTTGLVTSVSGGTSTISYSVAGCTSILVVTVEIAPPILGIAPLCTGGTTTLTDATAGGTWTSSTTSVATIGVSSGIVTANAPGTTTITYVTPAGCITTAMETVVVLSPITGPTHVCQGGTITLSSGSTGGAWTSSNLAVGTINPAGVLTGLSEGTTNITYTAAGGCFVNTTITVNPTAPITGVMSMCQNFTTTLNDPLPGGTWSSANAAIATVISTTGVVTGHAGGTATIIYTLPTGCAVNTVVTVNPKPAPPTPIAPFWYCQFTTSVPVSASGTNLLWYGPGVITNSIAPTPATSTPAAITYYVTQTSIFGCVSDSATDVITIRPQPLAPVTHDTSYCQGYNGFILPLNYEVDSATGSALQWFSPSGASLGGIAPIPSTTANTYPAGTTWHVTQTVNQCVSPQAQITVTIVPTPKFDLVYRDWVCQHDSILLSFNLSVGSALVSPAYYWQLPLGASPANGTSVTDPAIDVKFDTGYSTYSIGYFTVGNLDGRCATTDTFTVRVIPQPHAHAHCQHDVCKDDTVSLALSDEAANAENFFWKIDGITMTSSTSLDIVAANSNSGGPFSISWKTVGPHIITVSTSTAEGCMSRPTSDTIDVHDLPDASFSYNPKRTGALCLEDSILFTAMHADANYSYFWQPEHCFNNNNKVEIWGKVEQGRTDIMLTVTDPFGCHATTDQQLSPDACCTVLFPSAFSPNGDTKNDKFRPIFNGYHNFHTFKVVNRWGQVVFESANSSPEWDGNFNGVPQDIGVYYYYIKYDCGGNTVEERGDVTLVR